MSKDFVQSELILTAIIDGASRPVKSVPPGASVRGLSPGRTSGQSCPIQETRAGVGVIIQDENGHDVQRFHRYIGEATNNVAEYQALIACLESLRDFSVKSLRVQSDSELLVRQMQGIYRIKNERLRDLFRQVQQLIQQGGYDFQIEHVRREFTKEADKLANQAINLQEALEM